MTEADRALAYLAQRSVCDLVTRCWVWTRSIRSSGYAAAYMGGRQWDGHRLSYHYLVAPIPHGAVVHHRCATKICVNPAHLQATTHDDNHAEMVKRQWYERRIAALEGEVGRLLVLVAHHARSKVA